LRRSRLLGRHLSLRIRYLREKSFSINLARSNGKLQMRRVSDVRASSINSLYTAQIFIYADSEISKGKNHR
jgi:hypothetical protein